MNLTLTGNPVTFIGNSTFTGLSKLRSLEWSITPNLDWSANCRLVAGHVSCTCAKKSAFYAFYAYEGGCRCPAGTYEYAPNNYGQVGTLSGVAINCVSCGIGNYSSEVGAANCSACEATSEVPEQMKTTDFGIWLTEYLRDAPINTTTNVSTATSLGDCILLRSELDLYQEQYDAEQKYKYQQHVQKIIIGGCAGFVALVILGGLVICYFLRQLRLAEKKVANAVLLEKNRELDYYRDWRINEAEVKKTKRLAQGGEGSVWLGTFRDTQVAIKISFESAARPVWDEAEVVSGLGQAAGLTGSGCVKAFMMSVTHPRLVEFLGAGEMHNDTDPDMVTLFQVRTHCESSSDITHRYWNMSLAALLTAGCGALHTNL